jgi:hypothetical protein
MQCKIFALLHATPSVLLPLTVLVGGTAKEQLGIQLKPGILTHKEECAVVAYLIWYV